ncbi:MAG: CBS domain-containing protein [Desulfobacterales bacterium]|nr:CBS domain-containing protein [Desulfobacterales bacterium]
MRNVIVKELMVPIKDYATISQGATLDEAILALEKARMALEPSQHRHRAILVLDESGNVFGKITMKAIIIALEPNYRNFEGIEALTRSGYSPDLIKDMLEENALWLEPLEFACKRATQLKVSDFVRPPEKAEHVDEKATLGEAIHQLIMYPYNSLLVTRDNKVVGILRLADIFVTICNKIKTCKI